MDLAFIIVFGTRWHFRRVRGGWRGVLNCPQCVSPQLFQEMEAFKAFTLYWKPLWTLERGGRLVEAALRDPQHVARRQHAGLLRARDVHHDGAGLLAQ